MLQGGARALFVLLLLAGCTPAEAPARALPSYNGRSTELFDDVIEPRALGLDTDLTTNAKSDPLLRERVQIGDAALRVRVDTITVKQEGADSSFQIGFRILDKLAGQNSPGEGFTVKITKRSPSAGMLKSYE